MQRKLDQYIEKESRQRLCELVVFNYQQLKTFKLSEKSLIFVLDELTTKGCDIFEHQLLCMM
jgi:hypothetical protein